MKCLLIGFLALSVVSCGREKIPKGYPTEFENIIGKPLKRVFFKNALRCEMAYKALIKYPAEDQINSFLGCLFKMGWRENGKGPYDPNDSTFTGKWNSNFGENKLMFRNYHALRNSKNEFMLVFLFYRNNSMPTSGQLFTTAVPDNDTLNVSAQFITEQQSQTLSRIYKNITKLNMDSLAAANPKSKKVYVDTTNDSILID